MPPSVKEALAGLKAAGHEVDLLDLYAEAFDPVLTEEARRRYHDVPENRAGLETYIDRLTSAEAMVMQFPTWCFGMPAMLKGFCDRLMMPGVAFDLSDPAHVKPSLVNLRRIVGVVTYGRPWYMAKWMGDPPRKTVMRYLRWFTGGQGKGRVSRALPHERRHGRSTQGLHRQGRRGDAQDLAGRDASLATPRARRRAVCDRRRGGAASLGCAPRRQRPALRGSRRRGCSADSASEVCSAATSHALRGSQPHGHGLVAAMRGGDLVIERADRHRRKTQRGHRRQPRAIA